ncbi:MAG TPA: thioesterase family protein [Opitutaceae bacterium]|jgi:1,4-dihydroxy-2-naphthoyl-CoA hydrolase|nr:thioesterase family protein [Opitutaceae bacterium]
MPFSYQRTIHFSDTDAAGVVFFANFLALCHEAYEESLAAAGIELNTFFADHGVVVPIAKSEASYLRPLRAGDKVRVTLAPESLSENSYALNCEVVKLGAAQKTVARVRTEHVCIDSKTRERLPLPPALATWLSAG